MQPLLRSLARINHQQNTMKTETAHIIGDLTIARIIRHCEEPKLANIRIVLLQEDYGEEGTFYPAQSLSIYGPAIAKLRELLATLPSE